MAEVDFNFSEYVEQRKGAGDKSRFGGAAYAYPADQKVLRTLERVKPVALAVEATVRLWKNVAKSEILGTSVKVTDKQFPEIYKITADCSAKLEIAPPTVYIAPDVGNLNAHTLGTRDDSYIVLNGILVDHLSENELKFVIGHECGHIQNSHVVYMTALYYLMYSANVFVRWTVQPAVLALQSWARRAEITCDRAGILCCGDLGEATSALIRLALGSQKLADKINVEEYLKQLQESQEGVGRAAELFRSHPYLPKRVEALRQFADTYYYRRALDPTGEVDGKSLNSCDAEVSDILAIFRKD